MPRISRKETEHFDPSIQYRAKWLSAFEMLNLHGILTMDAMFRLQDEYKCLGSFRSAAKQMRDGGYIFIHPTYNEIAGKQNGKYLYSLSNRGKEALQNNRLYEKTIWPSGNDLKHQYLISAITSSIHIFAKEAGVEYIPGHRILAKNDTTLYCKEAGFTPDQLIGLKFGDVWRIHPIEAEMSYIDSRSNFNDPRYQHKSTSVYKKKLKHYDKYILDGIYKEHLGVNTGAVALFFFTAPGAMDKFNEVNANTLEHRPHIASQTIDGFLPEFKPQLPYDYLYDTPYWRSGCDDLLINTP